MDTREKTEFSIVFGTLAILSIVALVMLLGCAMSPKPEPAVECVIRKGPPNWSELAVTNTPKCDSLFPKGPK